MHSRVIYASELPVIMCTSTAENRKMVEAFYSGANDYITKPFDVGVTLARIGMHLELKRIQSQLRESEERYALAAQGANDGLWDWNLRTGHMFFSPRWREIMGYFHDPLTESPETLVERVHPEDQERVQRKFDPRGHEQRVNRQSEFRILHRDGSIGWVLCRWLAVYDRDVVTRIAGSISDITLGKVSERADRVA